MSIGQVRGVQIEVILRRGVVRALVLVSRLRTSAGDAHMADRALVLPSHRVCIDASNDRSGRTAFTRTRSLGVWRDNSVLRYFANVAEAFEDLLCSQLGAAGEKRVVV